MPSVSIPINQTNAYTTNRILIDPVNNEALRSGCNCNYTITTPCPYVPSYLTRTIVSGESPCIPSWCALITALKSTASSQLLSTNGAGNITPPLTTAQRNALEKTALMIAM